MTSIHCSFTIEEYQHVHDAAALRLCKIRRDKSPARHMAGYAKIKSLKSLMARIASVSALAERLKQGLDNAS